VARCSSDRVGRVRRLAQCWIWRVVVLRPRSSARSSSGAPTISALGLGDGSHPRQDRAAPGGQQHPQRLPLTVPARDGQVVLAKRLVGGPDRVQRVAFGAAAVGWPLGSAHLEDLLAVPGQELRQASTKAASPLDRPAPTARQMRLGEVQQPLVASGISAGGGLGQHATQVGEGCGGQSVAVGVDADDGVDLFCQHGHAVVLLVWGRPWSASAWEESPRGRTVMGHNPGRVGQAADQASEVGQADAGTPADSSQLKATRRGCQLHNESCRGASIRA
jgi:hypothetical protein